MTSYTCQKCTKTFPNKAHYNRHINKKKPCDKPNELKCPVCDREFARVFNVDRHIIEKHPDHPTAQPLLSAKTVQVADTINVHNDNTVTNHVQNVNIQIIFAAPNNITSPDVSSLTRLTPSELRKKIQLEPEVATLARMFAAIHLSENKHNHNVLLDDSANTGYFFHNKWRKENKAALLDRVASLSASELTDFDYMLTENLSGQIADEISAICSAVESEQLDADRSELLKDAIYMALKEFTLKNPDLLSHVKDAATSKKIVHDTARSFEEWKLGGLRYEKFMAENRS